MKENDAFKESDVDIKNIVDQKEAFNKIKHYDEVIRKGNKSTIRYGSIQAQMLKKFKGSKVLVKKIGDGRWTIYFKIGLYRFLKKYLALKSSSLLSHWLRNDFKMIKTVCKSNEELFT